VKWKGFFLSIKALRVSKKEANIKWMEGKSKKLLQRSPSFKSDLIREKGIERVTVQNLMEELETRGKHTIPVTIREDMLSRVRKFLEENNR